MDKEQFKLKLMQVAQQMDSDGVDPAEIQAFIDSKKEEYRAKYEAQEAQPEPQQQEAGVFQQEPSGDVQSPPQETQEPYQPDYVEIARKNKAGEQLTKDEHNAQQEQLAKAVSAASSVAGGVPVPEWMVPQVAAFGEGVLGLASGTVKGLKSLALWGKEKFDPDFAAEVAENPEARKEYFDTITDVDEDIDNFASQLGLGKRQFDSGSITELAARGELAQAGELAAQQVAGAVPSVMATMTGWGGMATLGVSAAGSSFEEDMERHPDQTIDRLVGAAWAKGGVELASEMVTRGIAKRAGLLLGKGQSVDAAKEFTESAIRRLVKDSAMEGVSEGAADTASKYIDELVHGDDYTARQYLVDFLDNAIVGAALGGGVSSIGALNSPNEIIKSAAEEAFKPEDVKEADNKSAAEMNAIEDQKKKVKEDPNIEEDLKDSMINELDLASKQIETEVAERHKEVVDSVNDMTEEELNIVAPAQFEIRRMKKVAEEATDPDTQQTAKNLIEKNKKKVRDVFDGVINHPQLVQQVEAVEAEADTEIAAQEQIVDEEIAKVKEEIAKEEAKEEPKEVKQKQKQVKELESVKEQIKSPEPVKPPATAEVKTSKVIEKVNEQKAKKQQARKQLEDARPGYDHARKSTKPKPKRKSFEELEDLTAKYKSEKNPVQKELIAKEALDSTTGLRVKAVNDVIAQLTTLQGTESFKGLSKTELRKQTEGFVADEFNRQLKKGKGFSTRGLTNRAKRDVIAKFGDRQTLGMRKPTKKQIKDKDPYVQKYNQAKEIFDADQEARTNRDELKKEISKYEREIANPALSRKDRRAIQSKLDVLSDALTHSKVESAEGVIASLDQSIDAEGATLADVVAPIDPGEAELSRPVDKINSVLGIDEATQMGIESAVQNATEGLNLTSDSIINKVGEDPMFSSLVDGVTKSLVPSKQKMMANAKQVLDALPEAWKRKNSIDEAADLDDYVSGTNQGRNLNNVRKAIKAGLVESYIDQAAKDRADSDPDVDATEYLEGTTADNKTAVVDLVMHLNRVYPDTKFFISKKAMVNKLLEDGEIQAATNIDGINAFLSPDGNIYLNPDLLTMESPIHELGHVWAKGIKGTELYDRGIELLRDSNIWNELQQQRKNPKSAYYNYSDARIEEEILATAIGRHANINMASDAQQKGWQKFIEDLSNYIKQVLGLHKGDPMKMDVHDYLSHAVSEILQGNAQTPSQTQTEMMARFIPDWEMKRSYTKRKSTGKVRTKDPNKLLIDTLRRELVDPSLTDKQKKLKRKRLNSLLSGKLEYSELADDALGRVQKELARLERLDQSLPGVADNVRKLRSRVIQLQKKSLPEATKLADMMMLNPILKNAIRAAKPVERRRGGVPNTDLQARKTVAAVMKVMSALPPAGRVEFANQLQRGIKSNTLAGNQNVAGFQNSIIAKEILADRGIDYEGIDMSDNLLAGVAKAMNNHDSRGVFGEDVDWSRVNYKGGDAATIEANKGAIKAFFGALGGLNKLGEIDGQTINKIQNIWGAAGQHSLYRGATGEPKFWHKNAKKGKGAQKGYIREHVLPASQFFDEAFSAARKGKLDAKLGQLLDNYQLVVLSEADDTRVNGAGFKDRQPDVFGEFQGQKLGELPASYMRYFNGKVAINPTDYVDANGRTMASYMGISPEAQRRLQSSGISGIEFSENASVNEARAENAETLNKERKAAEKALNKVLNDKYIYKTASKYKKSRISGKMRDAIEATKKDFARRGDSLTLDQIEQLTALVKAKVKDDISGKLAARKEVIDNARTKVNELIKKTSGVDVAKFDPNISDIKAKEARKWYNRLKPKSLSDIIMPSSNNDFYGLLYSLYPSVKNGRAEAKQVIDENIIKPLEDAGITYAAIQDAMMGKIREIKKANGIKAKRLNGESGIELVNKNGDVSIPNMTNDQIVKLYNYIKDPTIHDRLKDNGIDTAKMEQIIQYVDKNTDLKAYSDAIVESYRMIAQPLAQKLKDTGRDSFKTEIDPTELSDEQKDILSQIYPDGIPTQVAYTPLTLDSQEDKIEESNFETLTSNGKFNMPTVMDGRLKKRGGGGLLNLTRSTTEQDFASYLDGPARTYAYLDFNDAVSAMFGANQMKSMRDAYGPAWSDAMKDSIARILTGKTAPTQRQEDVSTIDRWIRRSVGGIMFFNAKSALLQLISSANFLADDPSVTIKGIKSKNKDKVKEFLKNSPWVKMRGSGKIDVAMDEVFSQRGQNWIDELIQKGYKLTQWGDKTAISSGGAYYMAGLYDQYIKDGMPEAEAMDRAYRSFVAKAEETQQSTRQERLGHQQTTKLGKLVLAFANTQQQYNRKMARALKDIRAGENVKGNIGTILYYGGIQNAIFTSAQKLMMFGFDLEDDEDQKWASSFADTILRGIGIWGAVATTAKNVIMAAMKDRVSEKDIYQALVNTSPALGTRARDIATLAGSDARKLYARSEWADDNEDAAIFAYKAAALANLVGLPGDRVVKILENASDAFASDLDMIERLMRLAGWSRYEMGASASSSPINKIGPILEVADQEPGVMGRANKDGSIEINPNLKGEERERVLKHEGKHAEQLKSGKLDYTDNYLIWNGKKYDRKNGKIYYKGKWMIEGDKSFPWEREADAAESK